MDEQWRSQPDRHPHRVSQYGHLVFRPRAPLGFFDTGLESFTRTAMLLEAHRQNTANFSEYGETRLELVFPIDLEPEATDVELSGSLPAGHPKLWQYALVHDELPYR